MAPAANDLSGTSPVDSTATLKADTWTLSETPLLGMRRVIGSVSVGRRVSATRTITVGLAGEATCTITNNDIAGHIVVDKVTVPSGDPTRSSTSR